MNTRFTTQSPGRPPIFILNASRRCEPSAFLFTKAVQFFHVNGYRIAEKPEDGEIILVNSCCVTQDKIATSREALDAARGLGAGKTVVLFGCMASLPELDRQGLICIGPKSLGDLDVHFPHHTSVEEIRITRLPPAFYEPGQGLGYEDYFLMIAQGCANRCSYCNIKRAKREVKSEPVEKIIRELNAGLTRGVQEFALLADDCASYGRDIGTDLVRADGPAFRRCPRFRPETRVPVPAIRHYAFRGVEEVVRNGTHSVREYPRPVGVSKDPWPHGPPL